jgi:hypothetical protein
MYVKLKALASWIFLSLIRFWRNSDSDFNFEIIHCPNMCSNIPASPAYGVYISQLIHYARASSNYSDFLKRHLYPLTWYRHFQRNDSLNQNLQRQTPRFHYGWKVPVVIITAFLTMLGQIRYNNSLDQGYKKIRLIRSFKKFIFRYQDLVDICSVSAEKIINDGFSNSSRFTIDTRRVAFLTNQLTSYEW